MRSVRVTAASAAAILAVVSVPVAGQEAAEPGADQLPPVEVIQQQPSPAPAAKKKAAAKKQVSPAPQAAPTDFVGAPTGPGPERTPDGRVVTTAEPVTSPITPSTILPADIQNYAGAATRVTSEQLDEQRPLTNHDILNRVPGVFTATDDGFGRHSGIGIRGAPFRRSRKTLVMEDGMPINFAPYLDPSTHYTPPLERIEDVEVLKGTVIVHGPLNNHGVVNFRNLSPFGENETVISGTIGHTEGTNKEWNNSRHVHTRQSAGHVGAVVSYSGADAAGSWDVEELHYNDFYGAIGFQGSNHDLVISGGYFRQRDHYDEANFHGTWAEFHAFGRDKNAGALAGHFESAGDYRFSTYNADYYRVQAAHNWYIDPDTTLSTKIFWSDHDRARFFPRGDVPFTPGDTGGGHMRGRDRQYEFYGVDSRIEFANVNFLGSIKQDIQAGIHFENQTFSDKDTRGANGVTLDLGNRGDPRHSSSGRWMEYDADIFSAFVQTAIHVTDTLSVIPGVRFEHYDIARHRIFTNNDVDLNLPQNAFHLSGTSDHSHVLPGVAFAWEALHRATLYGGYHRGITPSVVRGESFPLGDEIGDNFQVGLRTSSVPGFTLDMAYFHSRVEDYQIKSPFLVGGLQVFGAVDEVEINGFEIFSRLDSQPYTGGPFNFFGEAAYTYADSEITKSQDLDEIGNQLPESPRHFASLTVGVEERGLWDASLTWTYRGRFFTDTENNKELEIDGGEVEGGEIPDVWLLSARGNLHVTKDLSLFVAGTNLTDEFYATDLSDGIKPGLGRTYWAGFKWKLQ